MVCTIEGSNNAVMDMYVYDGASVASLNVSTTSMVSFGASSTSFVIGSVFDLSTTPPYVRKWEGFFDDFRMYNRALSAEEVTLLHANTPPVPTISKVITTTGTANVADLDMSNVDVYTYLVATTGTLTEAHARTVEYELASYENTDREFTQLANITSAEFNTDATEVNVTADITVIPSVSANVYTMAFTQPQTEANVIDAMINHGTGPTIIGDQTLSFVDYNNTDITSTTGVTVTDSSVQWSIINKTFSMFIDNSDSAIGDVYEFYIDYTHGTNQNDIRLSSGDSTNMQFYIRHQGNVPLTYMQSMFAAIATGYRDASVSGGNQVNYTSSFRVKKIRLLVVADNPPSPVASLSGQNIGPYDFADGANNIRIELYHDVTSDVPMCYSYITWSIYSGRIPLNYPFKILNEDVPILLLTNFKKIGVEITPVYYTLTQVTEDVTGHTVANLDTVMQDGVGYPMSAVTQAYVYSVITDGGIEDADMKYTVIETVTEPIPESRFAPDEWTLLARQTQGSGVGDRTIDEWKSENFNEDDPLNDNYSIIPELSKQENIDLFTNTDDGKYHMRLYYYNSSDQLGDWVEWKQTAHPFTGTVTGIVNGYSRVGGLNDSQFAGLKIGSTYDQTTWYGRFRDDGWHWALGAIDTKSSASPFPAYYDFAKVECYIKVPSTAPAVRSPNIDVNLNTVEGNLTATTPYYRITDGTAYSRVNEANVYAFAADSEIDDANVIAFVENALTGLSEGMNHNGSVYFASGVPNETIYPITSVEFTNMVDYANFDVSKTADFITTPTTFDNRECNIGPTNNLVQSSTIYDQFFDLVDGADFYASSRTDLTVTVDLTITRDVLRIVYRQTYGIDLSCTINNTSGFPSDPLDHSLLFNEFADPNDRITTHEFSQSVSGRYVHFKLTYSSRTDYAGMRVQIEAGEPTFSFSTVPISEPYTYLVARDPVLNEYSVDMKSPPQPLPIVMELYGTMSLSKIAIASINLYTGLNATGSSITWTGDWTTDTALYPGLDNGVAGQNYATDFGQDGTLSTDKFLYIKDHDGYRPYYPGPVTLVTIQPNANYKSIKLTYYNDFHINVRFTNENNIIEFEPTLGTQTYVENFAT